MKKNHYLAVFIISLLIASCKPDIVEDEIAKLNKSVISLVEKISPTDDLNYFILPEASDYTSIPQDFENNPITSDKVALGKFLFFETGIALDPKAPEMVGTYSCSSCHVPQRGFLPGTKQGIADGGIGYGLLGEGRGISELYNPLETDVQSVRPKTVMNSAFTVNTQWSGNFGTTGANEGTEIYWNEADGSIHNADGYGGMETQLIEGLGLHRMKMNKNIADSLGYTEMFDKAFPSWAINNRYGGKAAAFSVAAYLRTLLTNQAPFQDWLKGDLDALTAKELRGAELFFGKANCTNCHKSPALSSDEYHAIGVSDFGPDEVPIDDKRLLGRGRFTGRVVDMYRFSVPQLYNTKNYGVYFHGSSKSSLRSVIQYKNLATSENDAVPQQRLSSEFKPLNLSDKEVADLVTFISNSLFDADMMRYVPTEILSGNCFPNNDPQSKADMGCE